jgi:hypothetical protein
VHYASVCIIEGPICTGQARKCIAECVHSTDVWCTLSGPPEGFALVADVPHVQVQHGLLVGFFGVGSRQKWCTHLILLHVA